MPETFAPQTSVPLSFEIVDSENITDALLQQVRRNPDLALFSRKDSSGSWIDISSRSFHQQVAGLAKGLIASGVQPGDRIALMARTSYEWTLIDFSIWFAGAVTVPVYETSSTEQLKWILEDSGSRRIFLEAPRHLELLTEAFEGNPPTDDAWIIEAGALSELTESGAAITDETLEERRSSADNQDLASILYTSGTTGLPKGCELTHGNFVNIARSAISIAPEIFSSGARSLMFLPLAHVLARFIQVLCVTAGTTMGHTSDLKDLTSDLGSFRPTYILAVPRVFEKVYNSAEQKAEAGGKGKIFRAAADTAIAYSRALDAGGPGLGLKLRHALFDRLVYTKLRDVMGGRVTHAVSGGGPLGERLGHFFRGLGLIVMEGYGLTETTAPVTVNLASASKIGTVGIPLPGSSIKIAADGEILAKGIGVFRQYWKNQAATDDAFVDGWFHTGDLGTLDQDGYLRITGRKKEILVTAAGKNVAPAPLEDRLRRHPLVGQAVVVGDGRNFIAALLTLDPEMLPTWLSNNGLPELSLEAASKDERIRVELQHAVDDANKSVSRAESIRRFEVLPIELSEASGHLSAKQSIKRHIVQRDFADQVDNLYAGPPPAQN
ncbi:AMP-dependent synthetase/ligase [Saxibacter everestensis]|uniref:Acyl-CoA synthetase n=1 Tax=Saxibacter everestensis TaxID=2909229 RepID=A0ABY8QZW5_9MICO|nr:AMP-dependent synthetase/ligase [Brevibacteriaceae bacterium ZFBP1038]